MVTKQTSTPAEAKVKGALSVGDKKKAMKLARPIVKKKVTDQLKAKEEAAIPDFLKVKKDEKSSGGPARRVHFVVFGGRAVLRLAFRPFDTVEDAAKYFREFCAKREPIIGKTGLSASFAGSLDYIRSNMPIPDILAGKPIPKNGLKDLTDLVRATSSEATVTMPVSKVLEEMKSRPASQPADTGNPELDAILNSNLGKNGKKKPDNLIPLKVLCQELKIDPRQSRIALRKAVKDRKKYPALSASYAANARWEWVPGSPELEEVRTVLKGIAK